MKKAGETLPNDSEQRKKQALVADEKVRVPIIDCTEADAGVGIIIGAGGNVPDQQAEPKRAPSATSSHTARRGGAKEKKK